MPRKYLSIDEIIEKEKTKIDNYVDLISQEYIDDPCCPGGFRKPDKSEIKIWKDKLKYSLSIVRYLEMLNKLKV